MILASSLATQKFWYKFGTRYVSVKSQKLKTRLESDISIIFYTIWYCVIRNSCQTDYSDMQIFNSSSSTLELYLIGRKDELHYHRGFLVSQKSIRIPQVKWVEFENDNSSLCLQSPTWRLPPYSSMAKTSRCLSTPPSAFQSKITLRPEFQLPSYRVP